MPGVRPAFGALLFVTLLAVLALSTGGVLSQGTVDTDEMSGHGQWTDPTDQHAPTQSATVQRSTTPADTGTEPVVAPSEASVVREDYVQTNIDVGASVAAETERLRGQYRTHAFESEFDAAGDSAEKLATVSAAVNRINETLDSVDQRHGALLTAYGAGDRSASGLLRELAKTRATADAQSALADRIEEVVDADDDVTLPASLDAQFTTLPTEMLILPGPVLEEYERGAMGGNDTGPVYVHGTGTGATFALPDDVVTNRGILSVDQEPAIDIGHTRQATHRDARNKSAIDQFAATDQNRIVAALERAESLYPEISVTSVSAPFGGTNVYRTAGLHQDTTGALQAYLDGGTTDAYHELTVRDATDLPHAETTTDEGVEVTVAAGEATGPMYVSVRSGGEGIENGDPLAGATVEIGDQTVGTTDEAGVLRTTRPVLEDSVTVTTAAGETVSTPIPTAS